jgi:hypothetical protein
MYPVPVYETSMAINQAIASVDADEIPLVLVREPAGDLEPTAELLATVTEAADEGLSEPVRYALGTACIYPDEAAYAIIKEKATEIAARMLHEWPKAKQLVIVIRTVNSNYQVAFYVSDKGNGNTIPHSTCLSLKFACMLTRTLTLVTEDNG